MAKPQHKIKKANHGRRPANAQASVRNGVRSAPNTRRGAATFRLTNDEACRGNDRVVQIAALRYLEVDFNHVVADVEEIRRYNPQRYEMEQITAIVYESLEEAVCIGYKDVTTSEFWVRGHMPEHAADARRGHGGSGRTDQCLFCPQVQLPGREYDRLRGSRRRAFRDPVIPGDRLVLISRLLKARKGRMIISQFQGVVGERIVVEGIIKGIPIPVDMLSPDSTSQ